jgi:hypothetical protein
VVLCGVHLEVDSVEIHLLPLCEVARQTVVAAGNIVLIVLGNEETFDSFILGQGQNPVGHALHVGSLQVGFKEEHAPAVPHRTEDGPGVSARTILGRNR